MVFVSYHMSGIAIIQLFYIWLLDVKKKKKSPGFLSSMSTGSTIYIIIPLLRLLLFSFKFWYAMWKNSLLLANVY